MSQNPGNAALHHHPNAKALWMEHCAALWVETAVNTQVAIVLGILATLPVEQRRPIEDISRELEKIKPAIRAAVQLQILMSSLYTYKSLKEPDG